MKKIYKNIVELKQHFLSFKSGKVKLINKSDKKI